MMTGLDPRRSVPQRPCDRAHRWRLAALSAVPVLASSCTTSIGPTIVVTPGVGKSQAAFYADRRGCMATTDQALQPIADRMNAAAQTADQVQANNDQIQRLYNDSFGRCMSAQGNAVAAPAIAQAAGPPAASASPAVLDRSNSQALSDPQSQAAKHSIAPTVRELLAACTGETIEVDAYDAPISPSRTARLLALTQPHGGSCFGQPGENDYLVVPSGRGWSKLLAAEPGSIGILDSTHLGYADVELRSLGSCVFTYQWNGEAYGMSASRDCPFAAPPSVGDVVGKIRSEDADGSTR